MKILVVGDGHSAIHEVAVVAGFNQLGHSVESFYWQNYFSASNSLVRLWRRAQNKFLIGPTINRLYRDLVKKSVEFAPKLIFIYRGTHIKPRTLIELKRLLPECELFGYNNDDPFAAGHPPWLWRHFMNCVPIYDLVFAYRHHNLDDLIKFGAKRVELLRSWFVPELNHSVFLSAQDQSNYKCDVVFIGHFEDDGRMQHLEEIVKAGYWLRIFGPPYEWNKQRLQSETLKSLAPVHLGWDGTLLYQLYLMAQVCLKDESIYCDMPITHAVQTFRGDKPMFGNSEAEKSRFTPGSVSHDNSINFTKAYFEVTEYLEKQHGTNLTQKVRIDLSKYSYPFLSIQRKRGIASFLRYAKRLETEVGFGCTPYFYLYKWALVLFGERACDRFIGVIKRRLGHTPNF